MCIGIKWKRVILCTNSVSVFIYLLHRRVKIKTKKVKPKMGKGSWNTVLFLPSLMNTCIMFTCLERTQLSRPFFWISFVNRTSVSAPYCVPSRANRLEICFQSLLCSALCFKPSIPHLKTEKTNKQIDHKPPGKKKKAKNNKTHKKNPEWKIKAISHITWAFQSWKLDALFLSDFTFIFCPRERQAM